MELIKIAEKFGKCIHENKMKFDVDDCFLYGSLAKQNGQQPKDIDIMILHHNPVLEIVRKMRGKDNYNNPMERFGAISEKLSNNGYCSLDFLIKTSECYDALKQGLFDITYLHLDFLIDSKYREMFSAENKDPKFAEDIFSYGLAWNPKTEKFDTPVLRRYFLPEN
jgi:predicted nucleotidyltransferase